MALVAFFILTLASVWPLLPQFASALPSDLGDPALNVWILWWNAHAVPLTHAWWNAPMFAPAPDAFALSESLLALTPITTPLIRAGLSPVAAYNTAYVLSGPLTALGAYMLAWHLTRRRGAALIAALAFGFSPYRIAQLPHLQMQWACWLPLGLYALHRFVDSADRRFLLLFGVSWMMAGLTNGYFLIFFPVLIALWMAWFVRTRTQLVNIAGAWIASSLPLLPLLVAYRARQQAFGLSRGIGEIQTFSADLTAIWAAAPRLWLSSLWTIRPGPEGELYPGIAILALAIAGAALLFRSARARGVVVSFGRVRLGMTTLAIIAAVLGIIVIVTGGWELPLGGSVWSVHKSSRFLTVAFWLAMFTALSSERVKAAWRARSPLAFYLVAAGAMLLMALGPDAHVFETTFIYKAPYSWLMELPGGDSMRVPARFAELMLLCLSVAGALAFARLVKPGNRAAAAVVAAAVLCEGWIVVPLVTVPDQLSIPTGVAASDMILELPMTIDYPAQTRALLHGIDHGRAIVNGFSGYDPPHFSALRRGLIAGDAPTLDVLRRHGAVAAFVERARDSDGAEARRIAGMDGAVEIASSDQGTWYRFSGLPPVADAPLGAAIDDFTVSSSVTKDVGRMHDGSIGTRWGTGLEQREGTTVTLHLREATAVSAIELDLGNGAGDFPIELEILATDEIGAPRPVWRGNTYALTVEGALRDSRKVPIMIRFAAPVTAKTITLRLTATDDKYAWTIAEIHMFKP